MKGNNKLDNPLLTGIGNGDTAYNRLVNKELLQVIGEDEINENFKLVSREIKELITKKEGIQNMETLKEKIDEIIYQNKNRLPSAEYYLRTLKVTMSKNHHNEYYDGDKKKYSELDLSTERGEKELNSNIDKCLTSNIINDNIIKQIIIFTIMKQGFEFKRKRGETTPFLKDKQKKGIIHNLYDESE